MLSARTAIAWLALTTLCGSRASAQVRVDTAIDSGTLVRVRLADSSVVVGRLLTRLVPGATHIELCRYPGRPCFLPPDPARIALPAASAIRIDSAAGTRWRHGLAHGALRGFAVGLAAKYLAESLFPLERPVSLSAILVFVLAGSVSGGLGGTADVIWRGVQ